jgi:hypothetical protein
LIGGSRTPAVDVNGDAHRVRPSFDELEVQRRGETLEQRQPGAECGRLASLACLFDSVRPENSSPARRIYIRTRNVRN